MTPTIRTIDHHVVLGDPNSAALEIRVNDEPGQGGASHVYSVWHGENLLLAVQFQNGPIGENGINGVTQEILLAIVKDRLESFQAGPFASEYNARGLSAVDDALEALKQRTVDRMVRGVEGKNRA